MVDESSLSSGEFFSPQPAEWAYEERCPLIDRCVLHARAGADSPTAVVLLRSPDSAKRYEAQCGGGSVSGEEALLAEMRAAAAAARLRSWEMPGRVVIDPAVPRLDRCAREARWRQSACKSRPGQGRRGDEAGAEEEKEELFKGINLGLTQRLLGTMDEDMDEKEEESSEEESSSRTSLRIRSVFCFSSLSKVGRTAMRLTTSS